MKGKLWLMFAGGLLLSILVDLLIRPHGEFPWSGVLGFFAIFGFVGCLVIVLASKWLGHYWLQRGEDYYNGGDDDG